MPHRIYASFQRRDGWHVQFFEEELKTSLPRKLSFASSDKIIELAESGGADLNPESLATLQYGFEIGHGGFFLNLTDEQYAKLL